MQFELYKNLLYSDLLLPDIFISEYLPSMDGDYVKIYIYCQFLAKYSKELHPKDLSKKLGIPCDKVYEAFTYFENIDIIRRKENGYALIDLKEKEINKIYKMREISFPEEAVQNNERNIGRSKMISAINDKFFQGIMSPSWYVDIDSWFNLYKFDEDVMYALFQYCSDRNCLVKNYVAKVAEGWYSKNITNSFNLDKYYIEYQKVKDIKQQIAKKLNLGGRLLTEYESELIEKWSIDYDYKFEIIELALKRTTYKTNPNFNYINTLITTWHQNNLTTKQEIQNYLNSTKDKSSNNKKDTSIMNQIVNFEQRKYEDGHFDKYIANQ